ncbi:RNA polymerase sigma factor, sigma-70 family [Gemmatirosa kalamazoonensis]|uniref:RNA polymerase sigma factor, sigma-70 family n=1 Tax=Gemmatirosa kalamazoonensis TaxID=861299 RepID=W0REG0_9BACT|nr:RNA polymerase sigma factor [Gemmatirosa kalamazoonensis]AHG88832.1 RNA polymerase sigma factor, sigma-70 family [Gemmatirosa kalamazoonensis]
MSRPSATTAVVSIQPAAALHAAAGASESALVARASGGDGDAFATLVARLLPLVYRWALVLADDVDDADDITQDAFVQMHLRLAQFRGEAPLEAWLYGIVRRAAGQRRRRARRRARLAALPRALPERDVYVTDPGARVDRQQLLMKVRAFFAALPARQREIVDLVDLQGYDPIEVALMTGIKPATVRANLFKARAAVRAHLIARHPGVAEVER